MTIPFNKPHMTGKELWNISQAHHNGMLAGDGNFTRQCHQWLEQQTGCSKALLTHSCTAALEMAALLGDLHPGDEVIMPSYTFVSTANAFALRGAVPVFVDIRPDTLNLDERLIEAAISPRSKAIVAVHYAGVACAMEEISAIARQHNLLLIEDAAQGAMASYKGRPLGSIGDLGCLSFHETKNLISGEGGALLCNREDFSQRAEIIREKGTNRSQFFRGQVDKYTWVDIGSSYLPGELIAAFLYAQFEEAEQITSRRLNLWQQYDDGFAALEQEEKLRRPQIPPECQHNAHMYYILLRDQETRTALIEWLKQDRINAVFHYIPLHSSPAGQKFGYCPAPLPVTDQTADCLLRLPLYYDLDQIERILNRVSEFFALQKKS